MAEFASKGVAGTGLGTGIAGLSLGVINAMGGLGALALGRGGCAPMNTCGVPNGCGWNGWNGGFGCCSDNQPVNRYEMKVEMDNAAKDAEIAQLKAHIYTDDRVDQKVLEAYKDLNSQIKELRDTVYDNTCRQAVTNQKLSDNITFVDSKFEGVYREMDCRDRMLRQEIECKTLPLEKKVPITAVCPQPMPKYNSWTAPTTPATQVQGDMTLNGAVTVN